MADTQDYRFKVQYKFAGDYAQVEEWLHQNCAEAFNIVVDKKPARPTSDGHLSIYFKQELDRDRFRDQVLEGF